MSYAIEWLPGAAVVGAVLVRSRHRRLAERRQSTEGSVPIASGIAQTGLATKQSGVAAFAEPTTARRSQ